MTAVIDDRRSAPAAPAAASPAGAPRARTSGPVSVLRWLAHHWTLVLAIVVVVLVLAWAVVPGVFTSHDPLAIDPASKLMPPSGAHWFGTDQLGRDLYSRVVYGARASLTGAAIAVGVGAVVGSLLGALAGWFGGFVDSAIGRSIDVLLSIPGFLFAITIVVLLGFGIVQAAVAVGLTMTATFARLIRSEVLKARTSTYVEAATTSGASTFDILRRHVVPNSIAPTLSVITVQFGIAIIWIASLSFLGLGAQPPDPEWGRLVSDGRNYIATRGWLTLWPSLTIVAVVLATNHISHHLTRGGQVMSAVLSVEELTVGYRTRRGLEPVVHQVSFDVQPGQVLALVGESGSGKTTTGHAVLGLLPSNGQVIDGRIRFRDQVLTGLGRKEWRDVRGRAVSLIPQDPAVSLDPVRRVGQQVEDVLRLHTDLDARARRDRVHELFELVGFTDVERRYAQYPGELSGGMRQRVLIASAIAVEPDLIIADEPTSGLDATVQKQVLDLIDDLRARSGTSVVLVTHDLGVAADRSDRIGVMQDGRLVETGPTAQVLADPQHAYTRRLLDSVPSRLAAVRERVEVSESREVVVEVEDLRKVYGDVPAVDGASFAVHRGETFSIVGESGSGKSTTARILTGLTEATSGRVSLFGEDVTRLGRRGFRALRRDVQIVYQNPYASFDPRFDVYQVVDEPLRSLQDGPRRLGRRRPHEDQVVAALEAAALPADFVFRHPRELSGGQRQRVAIARALVLEPKVVVLDEPISALDVSVAAQILELLRTLQAERDLTYVFISHDLAVVRAISDRVAVMQRGRIVEQGPVERVFSAPATDYTVQLLDAIAGRALTSGAS